MNDTNSNRDNIINIAKELLLKNIDDKGKRELLIDRVKDMIIEQQKGNKEENEIKKNNLK